MKIVVSQFNSFNKILEQGTSDFYGTWWYIYAELEEVELQ